jgi:hypothetical protein
LSRPQICPNQDKATQQLIHTATQPHRYWEDSVAAMSFLVSLLSLPPSSISSSTISLTSSSPLSQSLEQSLHHLLTFLEIHLPLSSLPSSVDSLILDLTPHVFSALHHTTQALLFIFSPKRLLKQILATITLQSLIALLHHLYSLSEYLYSHLTSHGSDLYRLKLKLKQVNDYYEYRRIAADIDEMNQDMDWIEEDECRLFDYQILRKRIQSIERMEYSRDTFGLMFRLRGALSRDQYGLLHEGLYSRAYSGTKRLVQLYFQTVTSALNYICDYDEDSEVSWLPLASPHSSAP